MLEPGAKPAYWSVLLVSPDGVSYGPRALVVTSPYCLALQLAPIARREGEEGAGRGARIVDHRDDRPASAWFRG